MSKHIGQVWEALSRDAKRALVIGENMGRTVREELLGHGLIEEPLQEVDLTLTDKGQKVAKHGRWVTCNTMDRLQERFLYFTECALATVEELEMLSRPPKGRLRRHKGIADKMLLACQTQSLTTEDARRYKCGRVEEALQEKRANLLTRSNTDLR